MKYMFLILPVCLIFLFYCLFRRICVDSSAQSCSAKFCAEIKLASSDVIAATNTDKMFYTNEEVFWRFWDWSKECSIKDKKMYYRVIGK